MAGVATAYLADTMPSSTGAEWDYSVPIGNERSPMTRDSFDSNSIYTKPSHNNHGSRSSSASRNVLALDASYSNSTRDRQNQSLNHNSEVNNPRESIDTLAYTETEKGKEPGTPNELEKNSENWIHRDKLAKIESEELHRAAIQFQRRMRAESKSSAGREMGHDSYRSGSNSTVAPSEYSEPWPDMRKDSGPVRPGEDRKNWDLRRPEEISSQETAAGSFYSNPALRKSSSRIPISTASPVPLAPGRGNRSRAATDEQDDEARGRAVGEHHAMEANPSTPSPNSRPASRGFPSSNTNTPKKTPNKATTSRKASAPPPGSRKTSAAVRTRAASSNTTRPTTAVNRPEGDPPWLATMYKPDPRLPPDQQIIPTHAKKMQQEQWEKEDRTPTTYDRDFAPLAVRPTNEDPPPKFPKEEPTEKPKVEEPKIEEPVKAKTPEPQQPPPLQRSTSSGYSTMPKVQDTPPLGLMPNPNWTPPVVTAQAQEKPKDDKEDKGCGCCIVM